MLLQAFVDRQIQASMDEALHQMGALMQQADMDATAVYQATSWQPPGGCHDAQRSAVPHHASAGQFPAAPQLLPAGRYHGAPSAPPKPYQGGPSAAPFSRTASAHGKTVYAM